MTSIDWVPVVLVLVIAMAVLATIAADGQDPWDGDC